LGRACRQQPTDESGEAEKRREVKGEREGR